ncbi:choice-of-anchor K domain-containing protein [uncultured Roseobacter sp.]|uniref:choice-of-anchor K domain-containing protein n=1 Tax=uncultured Roseobacter sp. TaxID=114847 RepID=UPI00262B2625|nr:choice-of-anchor K domain-containing protein [uncultured Roseobacter sp.]
MQRKSAHVRHAPVVSGVLSAPECHAVFLIKRRLKMSIKHLVIGLTAVTFLTGAAQAATFSGSTSGTFLRANGFDGSGSLTGIGTSSIAWGRPGKSKMEILDYSFSHSLQSGTNSYQIGALEWFNATWYNFDDLFRVFANLQLDLDDPLDQTTNDTVKLKIDTSANNAIDPSDLAVITQFDDFDLALPFVLGKGITLKSFSVSLDGDGALRQKNGKTKWRTDEHGTSRLIINAEIEKVSAVPLPAAGWMLLVGVGGLMGMRHRKRAA